MLLTVDRIEDQTDHIRSIWLTGDELPGFTAGAHLKFDCGDAEHAPIRWSAGKGESLASRLPNRRSARR